MQGNFGVVRLGNSRDLQRPPDPPGAERLQVNHVRNVARKKFAELVDRMHALTGDHPNRHAPRDFHQRTDIGRKHRRLKPRHLVVLQPIANFDSRVRTEPVVRLDQDVHVRANCLFYRTDQRLRLPGLHS